MPMIFIDFPGSSPILMGRNVGKQFQPSAEEQDPCSVVLKVLKLRAALMTDWIRLLKPSLKALVMR